MHGANAVQMVEGIWNLLALFADEGLHEAAVVVDADHGRDVALQLGHLAGSPCREVAESHFVALADDVVQLVEHPEVDVVNLLHLVLQHLGLHDGVEQYLVRALECRQHVETLHQVGHADVVVALCLLLAGAQQVFVQQVVGVVWVEGDIVRVVGVGVNPDGVLAALEDAAEDGG